MDDDPSAVRLADVAVQLRRRWRVVAATIAVCAVAAVAFGLLRGTSYTATSAVALNPVGESDEVNVATARAVVTSTEVAKRAATILGTGTPPRDLIKRISVNTPTDAMVIEIEASAGEAARAAALANAFASGYLDSRAAAAESVRDERLGKIEQRIGELMAELEAKLAQSPGVTAEPGPAVKSITHEIDSLRDTRSALTARALNPGRVITKAAPPREPSSFGIGLLLVAGLAIGVLLGTALAMLRERTDRRVRDPERLAALTGLPVLHHLPGQEGDVARRLLARIGLDEAEATGSVAVVGTDSVSSSTVSQLLIESLRDRGVAAHPRQPDSSRRRGKPARPSPARGAADARVVVFAASLENGLALAVEAARSSDHVVLAVSTRAEMHSVQQLVEEIHMVDLPVAACVTTRANAAGGSAAAERSQPASGSMQADLSEEPTRYIDVEQGSLPRPAGAHPGKRE